MILPLYNIIHFLNYALQTCSAVTVDTKLNRVKGKLLNINLNMKTFQPMKEQKTFVNLNVDSDHVRSTLPKVDTCCPKHTFKHNLTSWIDEVNDTLPRVPCDMDPQEFYHKYMVPRIPVMLVGCTDDWKASKEWSFEKLMRRYGEDITWKCDVSLKDGSPVTLETLRKGSFTLRDETM